MKRAIFKMGRNGLVRSRHGGDTFEVPITSQWLEAKKNRQPTSPFGK